jgi:hypothetical protein
MNRFRSLLILLAAAACERAKPPARADSAIVNPSGVADSSIAAPATTWNPSVGPVLLVAADSSQAAYLIWPDSAAAETTIANLPTPTSVLLFGRNGSVQSARLPAMTADACEAATISAAPPPKPWSVGFIGGVVSPIALDSAASLPAADSASLVVWMNRLASAVPSDSSGSFAGLPFVVRALWRFALPNGAVAVAAELERQVNQEARPLQERTFLIAEHPAGDSTFTTTYVERASGAELTVEDVDLLAALGIGTNHTPALVIARDFGDGITYALLERGADRWHVQWVSARTTC